MKWITLDEYKINEKVEIKKSTQPHDYHDFSGFYYVAVDSAIKINGESVEKIKATRH